MLKDIHSCLIFTGLFMALLGCEDKNPSALFDLPDKETELADTVYDVILLKNANEAHSIGLLLDGNLILEPGDSTGVPVNDHSAILEAPHYILDKNLTLGEHNELIAFQRGRSPAVIENIEWTKESDTIFVEMPDEISITVHFWILIEPFDLQIERIHRLVDRVNQMWFYERVGIRIDSIRITESLYENKSDFYVMSCGDGEMIRSLIGYDSTALNLFLTQEAEFDPRAHYCGGNKEMIVMGEYATGEIMAHEIGHGFGLQHNTVHFPEHFDGTNNMMGLGIYITEGQAFMAQFSHLSYMNRHNLREGLPVRRCFDSIEGSSDCPNIQKRIWHDGEYRPN